MESSHEFSPEPFDNELSDQDQELESREDILAFAKEISQEFDKKGNIKKIGITGSVARGKEYPNDADLIFIIDEKAFFEYNTSTIFDTKKQYSFLAQVREMLKNKDEKKENFLFQKVLGLNNKDAKNMALLIGLKSLSIGVDIILLPDKIYEEETDFLISTQTDPTFLSNLAKDYQELDPESDNFKPAQMYSEEEMDQIRKIEFDALKKISTDPNHFMYKIYEEHPVKKHYR
ncbi:MAG: hypothetical protein M1429_02860 [Patescibacteria group bacterium]|nr:hypothetical protein [Patescibacteria group bacterium]